MVVDHNFYIKSGASNHVIADYNNVIHLSEYGGKDKVMVGNGNKLFISHIGSSFLPSHLKNVLCVSDMAKNLISVFKLAQDNSDC